jgi:hypothetical protein
VVALAIESLLSTPAHAVSITVGWWDSSNGVGSGVTQIYTQTSFDLFTLDGKGLPMFGPHFGGVLSALQTPDGYYEAAINDIFATSGAIGRSTPHFLV